MYGQPNHVLCAACSCRTPRQGSSTFANKQIRLCPDCAKDTQRYVPAIDTVLDELRGRLVGEVIRMIVAARKQRKFVFPEVVQDALEKRYLSGERVSERALQTAA